MRMQSAAIAVMALVPVMAAAQQFAAGAGPLVDPNARFEVAVIKAFDGATGPLVNRLTAGGFMSNLPVGVHLRQALQKPDYQIVGAPGWIDSERYAINAKLAEGVPPAGLSVMLLNLLKDRFQLRTHLETRELPIFNLVMARADGRPGADLKATSAECQAMIEARAAAAQAAASGRGGPPPRVPFPSGNDAMPCGFGGWGSGMATGSGRTLAQIAQTLSDVVGRPVSDRTGLTGMYDFALKFVPEGRVAGPLGPASSLLQAPGAPPPAVDPDAPSLAVALQEQLGLKFESTRGPVEVVVIDRLEKPALD